MQQLPISKFIDRDNGQDDDKMGMSSWSASKTDKLENERMLNKGVRRLSN